MELKEAENIVRSCLIQHKPSAHRIRENLITVPLTSPPKPDECFDYPGGRVVVEFEGDQPMQSVQKYWWLLNSTDYLQDGKKLALVVINLNPDAEPKEQADRERAVGKKLEQAFPKAFSYFPISADEAKPDVISAALTKAYNAVKA